MRHELGDAIDFVEELDDSRGGEMAGFHDADRFALRIDATAEHRENGDRSAPRDASPSAAIVDDANVWNAVLAGETAHDREDARQHVEMLMSVQMRDAQAGREDLLELRAQFALDVDTAARQHELHVTFRHRLAGRERALFDEREVRTDFERWHIAQSGNGVVERVAVRDDRAG